MSNLPINCEQNVILELNDKFAVQWDNHRFTHFWSLLDSSPLAPSSAWNLMSNLPFNEIIAVLSCTRKPLNHDTQASQARPLTPDIPQFTQTARLVLLELHDCAHNVAPPDRRSCRKLSGHSKNSPKFQSFIIFWPEKNHWIHLAKTTKVLSPQIWSSLEQPHYICTFLPSKAPWGPYGPLGVNVLGSYRFMELQLLSLTKWFSSNLQWFTTFMLRGQMLRRYRKNE